MIRRLCVVVGLAALVTGVIVSPTGTGSGTASAGATDDDQMVAEGMRVQQKFVQFWNEKKFDELGALYMEDAIAIPPNHEPIRGRAAIAEFYKGLRDVAGELEGGTETWRGTPSGNLVSVVGKYSVYSGRVRFTSHELFKRQPDGSLKYVVDMYGYRDPQQ
jgi:ketosteroid isomerase-like protein